MALRSSLNSAIQAALRLISRARTAQARVRGSSSRVYETRAWGRRNLCFFFNDTATPEIYPLPLHDALPIYINGNPDHTDECACQDEHYHPRGDMADPERVVKRPRAVYGRRRMQKNLRDPGEENENENENVVTF